ncbi:putative extracellular dihydrogeodin oxidase/laccase [Xylariales sp. PMI_506]|nr:putative extracellular dihydrogeodin oxidase/laccase [Xylariales sp. PMI_506]
MKFLNILYSFLLTTGAAAAPSVSRSSSSDSCINGPDNRSCWGDYDISTNYYEVVPDTGVVREYWFNIVNTTAAPDGFERVVLSVNGTVPGPTIIADWGDTVVVHVTNSLENNGTSIHWHGIRQNYTNQNDGVPSLTQCPVAPGQTYTYTWRAAEYGSSWYHSHFYVQAWDGVFGGIQINGPASANYDEDLGTLTLSDWSHLTTDVEVLAAAVSGPPTMDNGLINGTNVWGDLGSRFETVFEEGSRYRIRLINTAADTSYKFTIDGHTFQVIAADFVPIEPYSTDILTISMGQRYDIIVTANATSDNYWLRAIAQNSCSKSAVPYNVTGIVRYDSTSTADPESVAWASASVDDCDDEEMSLLVPVLALPAASSADAIAEEDFEANLISGAKGVTWSLGAVSFVNQWDYPTALQLSEGNTSWAPQQEVIVLDEADKWVYFVIENNSTAPHPMHLHGHDFWVLAQGNGTYDPSTTSLSLANPPRRDVVQLPGKGHVVIAFKTDNPGAWLMHCHIAWHTSEGLAIQILERQSEILPLYDSDVLTSTCDAWNAYANADHVIQDDSGV